MGNLGHFSIVTAFVTILLGAYSYFIACQSPLPQKKKWSDFANGCFIIHSLAILTAFSTLFWILYSHQYQYQYAWKHTSTDLPIHYLVSSIWEGQEGSFLLWMLWNSLLGLILLKTSKWLKTEILTILCLIQLFLVSMVLGVHIGALKIGSSPFLLLRDTVSDELFRIDPGFVPKDGSGLNPLLQNIWMAIHPPVIFLGFAISGVPFCYALAALWKSDFSSFHTTAVPWIIATTTILGIGIMMGAYWAYETLNFGGYWNWDPVENAVLVPWLVFMGALHGITLFRRKGKGLALSLIMIIAGFILILYSTFLTRSGILGNASVHAFTDLGLSAQLLGFLVFFVLLAFGLTWHRRGLLRENEETAAILSLEFWMLFGVCVFGLSAFQILLPTSLPVLNELFGLVGIPQNFAPPADPVAFYSKFQLWFATAFCLLAALGQLFFWKNIRSLTTLEQEILIPATIAILGVSIYIGFTGTIHPGYIMLILSAFFLLMVSLRIGWALLGSTVSTSLGGLLAHVGMSLMLIGIVYSAGHQRVISQNLTLNMPDSELPIHSIQEHLLLTSSTPKVNNGFTFTYLGPSYQEQASNRLIPSGEVIDSFQEHKKLVKKSLSLGDYNTGDTILVSSENTYYPIEIKDEQGATFLITPRMQNNPTMGYIASPDIKSTLTRDIYTHITNFPDPEKVKWNEPVIFRVKLGEVVKAQGLQLHIEKIEINQHPVGIPASENDIPLEASIKIEDQSRAYTAHPIYFIDSSYKVRLFPDEIGALGMRVMLSQIHPEDDQYEITLWTSQRDWITIKSIEMPLISLVWTGFLILISGMGVAFYFRYQESRLPANSSPIVIKNQCETSSRVAQKELVNS